MDAQASQVTRVQVVLLVVTIVIRHAIIDAIVFIAVIAQLVIVAINAQIVKLAIHNVIQTINHYRLYINDIHKADNEVKYTKLNKKITNVTIIT